MSHFYGTLKGHRGEATRAGSKASGLVTHAASWNGAIRVRVYVDKDGDDAFEVQEVKWRGAGITRPLSQGKIGKELPSNGALAVLEQQIKRGYNPFEPDNQADWYPQLIDTYDAIAELISAARMEGELIHAWRESGVPPSLRELSYANERLAFAIAKASPT